MPSFKRPTQAEYEAIFSATQPTEQVVQKAVRDGQLAPLALASSLASIAKAAPGVALAGLTAAHAAIEAVAFAPVMFAGYVAASRRTSRQHATERALSTLGISQEQWAAMREKTLFAAFQTECKATWDRNRKQLRRLSGFDVGAMPDDYAASRWAALQGMQQARTVRLADKLAEVAPAGPLSPEAEIAATVADIVQSGVHAPAADCGSLAAPVVTQEPEPQTPAIPEAITAAVVAETAAGMREDSNAILAKLDNLAPLAPAAEAAAVASVLALPDLREGHGGTDAEAAPMHQAAEPLGLIGTAPGDVSAQEAAAVVVGFPASEPLAQAAATEPEPVAQQAAPTLSEATIAAQAAICDAGRAFADKPCLPTGAEYRKVAKAAFKAGHIDAKAFANVKLETAAYVAQKRGVKGGK